MDGNLQLPNRPEFPQGRKIPAWGILATSWGNKEAVRGTQTRRHLGDERLNINQPQTCQGSAGWSARANTTNTLQFDPSGRKMSDPEKRSKQKAGLEGKQAQKMKAESRLSVSESKIRACGGGRCGRVDMILSGRRDVRRATRRNEPLMIPSGIQSCRQQRRRRRDETRKVKLWGLGGPRSPYSPHSSPRQEISKVSLWAAQGSEGSNRSGSQRVAGWTPGAGHELGCL